MEFPYKKFLLNKKSLLFDQTVLKPIIPVIVSVNGKKARGWDYETTVGFSYDIAKFGYGVLGQKGFFDIFMVKFDYQKEKIELKELLRN